MHVEVDKRCCAGFCLNTGSLDIVFQVGAVLWFQKVCDFVTSRTGSGIWLHNDVHNCIIAANWNLCILNGPISTLRSVAFWDLEALMCSCMQAHGYIR